MTNSEGSLGDIEYELQCGFEELVRAGEWDNFLRFCSAFHTYSPRNILMIYLQAQERGFTPTRVAGYTTWRRLGNPVRRGEKGLRVLVPIFEPVVAAKVSNPRPSLGESKVGAGPRRPVGFSVSYVFDVSQTTMGSEVEPCQPQLLGGEAIDGVWEFLVQVLSEGGFTVDRAHLDDANGRTDIVLRAVTVDDGLPPAHALKTLAHEAAHACLHSSGASDRSMAELEAESAAFIFMHHLGVDSGAYSFPYLLRWSNGELRSLKEASVRASSLVSGWISRYSVTRSANRAAESVFEPSVGE